MKQGTCLVSPIRGTVSAAKDYEDANEQIQAALKNTGQSWTADKKVFEPRMGLY